MLAMQDECIHDLFSRRASERPTARALVRGNETLSYAELDRLSDALALHLKDNGVQHGDVVALLIDRSFELFIAMLGVLKCAAAYMPLDSSNPPIRNQACLDAANVRLIISDRDCELLCHEGRKSLRFVAGDFKG